MPVEAADDPARRTRPHDFPHHFAYTYCALRCVCCNTFADPLSTEEAKSCNRMRYTEAMLDPPFALTPADQEHLSAITRRGRTQARTFQRASALLQLQAPVTPCSRLRRRSR